MKNWDIEVVVAMLVLLNTLLVFPATLAFWAGYTLVGYGINILQLSVLVCIIIGAYKIHRMYMKG